MEGMRGWVRRHGPALDRERTRVIVLETLGSPELILLEGEGMIWMTDYDPEVRDFIAASAQDAGVAAAARAAARLRHRRAVGAARGLPDRHARLLRRVQDAGQLPLAARHPAQRRLRDGRRRARGSPRRRSGEQRAREAERVLARARSRPRSGASSSCGEQRAELRARAHARARARARRRARAAPAASGGGRAPPEHLARDLEVGGDRRLGVAPARGEPVGDGEDASTSAAYGRGGAQVAPDRAARRAGARGRGSRAAGGGAVSAAT